MDNSIFSFAGHQTFPLRQLWLYKAYDYSSFFINNKEQPSFEGKDAMLFLGVGKNMVESIKFWAKSCGILDSNLSPTPLANLLFSKNGLDPYAENPLSTWLFHWNIAKNSSKLTALWYLFNIFNKNSFSRENLENDFTEYLNKQVLIGKLKRLPSLQTIKRDIDTILRGYSPKNFDYGKLNKEVKKKNISEEATDSLFSELNLIYQNDNKYIFNRKKRIQLKSELFVYCFIDYWKTLPFNTITIDLDKITFDEGSPGRVFKLDAASIEEYLLQLEELTNSIISWEDQTGIKQVVIHSKESIEELQHNLLLRAYKNE